MKNVLVNVAKEGVFVGCGIAEIIVLIHGMGSFCREISGIPGAAFFFFFCSRAQKKAMPAQRVRVQAFWRQLSANGRRFQAQAAHFTADFPSRLIFRKVAAVPEVIRGS